jgi:HK97 family phage major capsid protein
MSTRENLERQRDELIQRAQESQNIEEVRMLHGMIDNVRNILSNLDTEERAATPVQHDEAVPAGAELRGAEVRGSFTQNNAITRAENPLESIEYRKAFMDYALNGTAIPAQFRAEAISTGDTAPAIPLTIMREVINTVRERYGNLYAKVRKTAMKGGVEYPIGALKATFKWINESTASPRQKLDPLAKIQFAYHTAEIRIAQTFLSQLLTIEDFENKIVEVIAIAYLEAMDYGIINGTGNGQMLGILNDPRVTSQEGHIITMTAAQLSDWTQWRKRFFSKIPLGYRGGEFIFPLSTVDAYLETMADGNNNPIFRQATGLEVNDGDARDPNGRFFGRSVSLVEPTILPDFDSASSNDIIGIYWDPREYAINENFGFTMRRYFDEETNEWVDKALVVVDGKVLNPKGIYLIAKA